MPLGPFTMFYGFGASPIVVDGMLILCPSIRTPDPYLLAVDAQTGKPTLAHRSRPHVISGYSTPTIYGRKTAARRS